MNKHVYVDLLKESLEKNSGRPCLHIKRGGSYQSWTYAEFQNDLNRCASVLKNRGFKRGVNGAVIGENTPEWIIAYHSIILSGGCTVPIDPNLPTDEIAEIINTTKARVVFCSNSHLPIVNEIRNSSSFIDDVVVLDAGNNGNEKSFSRFIGDGDAGADAFAAGFGPEDDMVIIFTSGTTGKAKGAVLTQKNYTAAGLYGVSLMELCADDTVLAILPLHHVFGFAACIAAPLSAGLSIVFVPVIKGPLIVEACNDKKVSMLPAVPKMLTVLYDNIEHKVQARGAVVRSLFAVLKFISATVGSILGMKFRRNLFKTVHEGFGGSLRVVISGGASLGAKYFRGFTLMGFEIVEGYGLTETFGPITICPIRRRIQGSVGPALPENEIKIADPDKNGVGEVLLKGTTVFAGYYNNEKATKAVFDDEGWFHTGDLGRLSKDGYLFLSGRSKDIIVLESGKNVYPDELEDYYETSDLIDEIGVFGYEIKGRETIAALIVPSVDTRKKYSLEKSTEIIQNELIRLGRNRPSYKKISNFAVVYQPLPRTTTRKLKKPVLRRIYEEIVERQDRRPARETRLSALEESLMAKPDFSRIVSCIRKVAPPVPDVRISPRSHLEIDLEFDSLRKLDLFCALEEEFKIVISEETLTRIETVGDVFEKISEMLETASKRPEESQISIRERIASGTALNVELSDNTGIFYNAAPHILTTISRLLWNVKISEIGNVPHNKPVIFVSNHQSIMDIIWIIRSLPPSIRKKTFTIGKVELLRLPIISELLRWSNMIPVEREGDVVDALRASIAVLKKGKNLIIFPEGTRTPDGKMGRFKSGIGLLMLETNAAVIPVRIRGSRDVWPKGKLPRLFAGRNTPVTVAFGSPFTLQTLIEKGAISAYSTAETITDKIREIILEL